LPPYNGLRFDDEQRIPPALESAGQQDEEAPIRARETWAPDRAVQHDELLTEQEVLGDQSRLAASEVTDDAASGGVRDGLGQAREGGASRSQTSSDDRLDEPHESEPHLLHPSFFDN
jgi:hypothetical protein